MEAIIIKPKNKSDLNFLKNLATRMGANMHTLSMSEYDDFALGELMKKVRTGKIVSEESVMKKLRK